MFTGIVESVGTVEDLVSDGSNLHIKVRSEMAPELKVDQSVSHNGVCLTVTKVDDKYHVVTAIHETLDRSNLGQLGVGDPLNLERCMPVNGRFDGHIVQGHVDTRAEVIEISDQKGSWLFGFRLESTQEVLVEKGSICINGVSLTCFGIENDTFHVAVIPYTFQHTNFGNLKKGSVVNIEFDIIGKYITQLITKNLTK